MKCAFVNLGKHFGGAEKYLLTIIGGWIKDGEEAIIIARKDSYFAKEIKKFDCNIKLYEVNFRFKYIKRMAKILQEVDIIDVNGINSGVFIKMTMTNTPIITTVHSNAELDRSDKPKIIRSIFLLLENVCLKKSKRIIAVSEVIKNILVERNIDKNKITVINNGVSIIDYPEKRIRKNKNEKIKICFVGRLETVKGCEYLLDSLKMLKHIEFSCDIYGDGSLLERLKDKVCKEKLKNKVFFKGFSTDIRNQLQFYDILVLPSLFEAFPLIIPEAMNAKVVLVCSKVGGIPYIIKNEYNGYLFEKQNGLELSNILNCIAENPERQIDIVNNAYDDFLNKYTEKIMIEHTFKVIRSCV